MSAEDMSPDHTSHAEALDWLAEVFDMRREKITAVTQRDAIRTWDSLGQLILMAALDERFGLRLSEDDISRLDSIGDVLEILHANGKIAGDQVS